MAARGKGKTVGGQRTEFNMTPMIDVTFQLIIFFIIAGQAADDEIDPKVRLHEPVWSMALDGPEVERPGNHVIVNAVAKKVRSGEPADDRHLVEYYFVRMPREAGTPRDWGKVYPNSGNAIETLTTLLKRKFLLASPEGRTTENKKFVMILRADRDVYWNQIQPILDAAVGAKIPNMNLAALTRTGSGEGSQQP